MRLKRRACLGNYGRIASIQAPGAFEIATSAGRSNRSFST
jgi:hypothetical protein